MNPSAGKSGHGMWRIIKVLVFLILLAAVALVAYAYVGPIFFPADFAPPSETMNLPVTLDAE